MRSDDHQCIAITEDAVVALQCTLVCFEHLILPAGIGRGNKQRWRCRLVEVGDEPISDLEFVWRVDELVSPAPVRLDDPAREHTRFKCAHYATANCVHVFLRLESFVDDVGRVLGYLKVLAVHAVLCQIFYLDGLEDALSDVELNRCDLYALLLGGLEQLLGEVQSSRRRAMEPTLPGLANTH